MSEFQPAPLGESLKGDMTEVYFMMASVSNALLDEPRCLKRCSHGGICTLATDHNSHHDADGFCEWGEE